MINRGIEIDQIDTAPIEDRIAVSVGNFSGVQERGGGGGRSINLNATEFTKEEWVQGAQVAIRELEEQQRMALSDAGCWEGHGLSGDESRKIAEKIQKKIDEIRKVEQAAREGLIKSLQSGG
jgi:hypothetical protein